MRSIGVCLSKGGVGKSTTVVSLAHGLARLGRRVLLVDTDTQGHCAKLLGVSPGRGLAEVLEGEVSAAEVMIEARPGLWLIAGGQALGKTKRYLGKLEYGSESAISTALTPTGERFDYCLVDTSPGWDVLTVNVLFYVQEVLCPVSLEVLAVDGLGSFLGGVAPISQLRRQGGGRVEVRYILPTFFDRRVKKSGELLTQLEKHFGDSLCDPIRYSVKLSEAPAFGQTIFEFAPRDRGAEDYARLIERVSA